MVFSAQGMLFKYSTATGVTTGTANIGEVVSYSFGVPARSMIDVSHLGSTMETKIPGILKGAQITLEMNYVATDAGQVDLRDGAESTVKQSLFIGFSDTGKTCVFHEGYISAFDVSGGTNDKNRLSVTFDVVSPSTWSTYT